MMTPTLAVIVPCLDEEESLSHTIFELTHILKKLVLAGSVSNDSFVLLVDDGSSDQTWHIIAAASAESTQVNGLRLSRNFGHQHALMAGLAAAEPISDITVSIDADLQQDPEVIPEFITAYSGGADVVYGVRRDRNTDSMGKRTSATMFYRLMRVMGVEVTPNHADYRLLSGRALRALLQFSESHIFLRGLSTLLGFKTATVFFDVKDREYGYTKYSLRKMVRFALFAITSFSVVPLRMVFVCGIVCFAVSTLMGAYILASDLSGQTVPGWASTTLPIYLLAGVQLLCLGVVGEYVGKIYSTVQARPRWLIWETAGISPHISRGACE